MTRRPAVISNWVRVLFVGFFVSMATPQVANGADISVGYLGLLNDPRYDADMAYARIQLRPQGDPVDGAMMALNDMKIVTDAVGLSVSFEAQKGADADGLLSAARTMQNSGINFILTDLPAAALDQLAEALEGEPITLLNVSAPDDDLRTACHPNLIHLAASDRMISDALTQFMRIKNWTRVLMLVGKTDRDEAFAASFRNSAERLRLNIVGEREFDLSTNPELRDQNNVQLLTSGTGEYDVVFIADSDGEFSRYVPYQTSLPRPVIGNAGLTAIEWHWSLDRYGAPQVNSRFESGTTDHRRMGWQDWSAWVGMKAVLTAYAKSGATDFESVDAYLRSSRMRLDGSKGVTQSFRPWNGQMRQPILLATDNAVISIAPLEGFLHQTNTLDTLGADEPEFKCD